MMEPRVDVFFYGSFINRRVLADHGLVPATAQVASLHQFEITIQPLANLHPAAGSTVHGIVVAATHAELARLYDHAERGLGGRYLPRAVVVKTQEGQSLPALCYIAPALERAPAAADYVDRIVGPARELGFPADYIARLESFRTVRPQSSSRDVRNVPAEPRTTHADLASILSSVLLRDLATVRREVEAYDDEQDLWLPLPGLNNSGGTLVLHIAGNLQHYLGARLGGSPYVRDREAEFARRAVPRAELVAQLDAARQAVELGLSRMTEPQLSAPFPDAIGGFTVQTGEFLVHLAGHLAFHLGQLDAHRRASTRNPKAVGAVAVGELATARKAQA